MKFILTFFATSSKSHLTWGFLHNGSKDWFLECLLFRESLGTVMEPTELSAFIISCK